MIRRLPWLSGVLLPLFVFVVCFSDSVQADGPADNQSDQVRRIPQTGIEVPADQAKELAESLKLLKLKLDRLRESDSPLVQRYLPDAEVYYWAAFNAVNYNEFFRPQEIPVALQLTVLANERIDQLSNGKTPWRTQTGPVIRGYRSKIDHSIQPYAVYVPSDYRFAGEKSSRCDLWFHGRGETLSELSFIQQRMRNQGAVSSDTHFMVHPYGRYSNANKFAGEIDTLEVLEHLQSEYRIDEDRIAVRGFSMGGAACWQFAVHYPDRWFAATPGAGFSETPEFLKSFQRETLTPTDYEKRLWSLYNCTDQAINLFHLPTIAYSGEIDRQKQAADIMEEALRVEGIDLIHIIGPGTEHKIHPDSLVEIESRLNDLEKVGRETNPSEIHFATFTLRYNKLHWVTIDGLAQHWQQARIDAKVSGESELTATTLNVDALTFSMPPGTSQFHPLHPVRVSLDGQVFDGPRPKSDRSWSCSFYRDGTVWKMGKPSADGLQKRHGLQGPIDDAFMDSFIFVEPTGESNHPMFEKWSRAEFAHAVEHWRRHFRGHARIRKDSELTDEEIASSNLVLFGDPTSNAILGKIADKLPIVWGKQAIRVGDKSYPTDHHGLVMVFPNPLNPARYVVLNSGFTFREYDYLNNARQVPKLPDWAIIDLNRPVSSRTPGKVVEADFFDENWQLKTK